VTVSHEADNFWKEFSASKHEMQLLDFSEEWNTQTHTHTALNAEDGGFNKYPAGTISLNKLNARLWACKKYFRTACT
jgi:hypothetical protein